jgi:hypothetical protein
LIGGLTLLVAAAAAFFWFAASESSSRKNATRVNLGRQRYQVDGWRILRDGAEALVIPATCARAYTMVVDIDQDDLPDLYVRDCDRHGYVKSRAGVLVWVDLGDFDAEEVPALSSLWAREIRDEGRVFTIVAAVATALAGIGLAGLMARLVRRRARQTSR